jgi:D-alanyl-D-alanine carboxypeptidase (penicillin-binding protein 5/6)
VDSTTEHPVAPAAPTLTRKERRQAARPSHRRLRPRVLLVLALVLVVVVAGLVLADRATRPTPPARATSAVTPVTVPGTAPALPWPAEGQGAVAVPSIGFSAGSPGQTPVPVASMTKIMTGYVVLKDHPLTGAEPGPTLTMTPADVGFFDTDATSDQANLPVTAGQQISERLALQGMLVHSANNLAEALAAWDAGSEAAFVAKMNAAAAALGMTQTHFADASGYLPASQSTANDILKVAAAAMQFPAFAQAVDMSSVDFPGVGRVQSYTPFVGVRGVVGVKSGYTSQAGGCDVLAARRTVAGHSVLVLAASTGQTVDDLLDAGLVDLSLVGTVTGGLRPVTALEAGSTVGHLSGGGHSVPVVAAAPVRLVAWPGQVVTRRLTPVGRRYPGAPSGTAVGTAEAVLGRTLVAVPARTAAPLPPLTLAQRLF